MRQHACDFKMFTRVLFFRGNISADGSGDSGGTGLVPGPVGDHSDPSLRQWDGLQQGAPQCTRNSPGCPVAHPALVFVGIFKIGIFLLRFIVEESFVSNEERVYRPSFSSMCMLIIISALAIVITHMGEGVWVGMMLYYILWDGSGSHSVGTGAMRGRGLGVGMGGDADADADAPSSVAIERQQGLPFPFCHWSAALTKSHMVPRGTNEIKAALLSQRPILKGQRRWSPLILGGVLFWGSWPKQKKRGRARD